MLARSMAAPRAAPAVPLRHLAMNGHYTSSVSKPQLICRLRIFYRQSDGRHPISRKNIWFEPEPVKDFDISAEIRR